MTPMSKEAQDFITWCDEYARYVSEWRERKGFYTPTSIEEIKAIKLKFVLIGTEMFEAIEAVRKNNMVNFAEELADVVIRVLDLMGTLKIKIASQATALYHVCYNEYLLTFPEDNETENTMIALHETYLTLDTYGEDSLLYFFSYLFYTFKISELFNFDLKQEIINKMEINEERPYKHGKQC